MAKSTQARVSLVAQNKRTKAKMAEDKAALEDVKEKLAAVKESQELLEKRCSDRVETHQERSAQREKELQGCREALAILSGDASLLQKRKTAHQNFLGM